ncbi:MAG: signal transduction histidine kinase [Arenicella sp.]|jgi:signal transduction histidine kinase
MTSRIKKKSTIYAEDLSHELLTPLAVIRTKAELLLQSPNLDGEDLKSLDVILKSVSRMNRLNKALILLSKIDNDVYEDRIEVNLQQLCEEVLENYEDQIRSKNLRIRFHHDLKNRTNTNYNLVEILINNLLKNAVNHNIKGGEIQISLKNCRLDIKNTFDIKFPPPPAQFKRFTSSKSSEGSLGLGLSIVEKIVSRLDLEIKVHHSQTEYHITILF